MALIKVKVLKPCVFDGKKLKKGDELVVHRKSSQDLVQDGSLESERVLDPRNAADKPLIDKWMAEHSKEEKPANKAKK